MVAHIFSSSRKLKIIEIEEVQLPRVLKDPQVTIAIITTTFIQKTGLSSTRDSLFIEDKHSSYMNIIMAR